MADIYSPRFFDASGQAVELTPDQVPDALANGTAFAMKGTKIPVINEDGKPVTIASEDASEAFKSGSYKYESPEEQAGRHEKNEYNASTLRQVEAAAAGAARGVSFGGSDLVLTKSGLVNAETLAKLQKYYPATSIGGEIAGAVLPSLFTGGAAAPESAALLASNLAAKSALGSIKAAAKLATSAPATLSLFGKTAAEKIVARAAERSGALAFVAKGIMPAAEGAAYGIGGALSEASIGHPDEVGEHFLATVGPSAITGAVLGVGLHALVGGAKAVLDETADLVGSLKSKPVGSEIDKVDIIA